MNTKKKRFAPKKRLIKHFLALTLAGSLLLPGLVLIRTEPVQANVIVDMASGVVGKLRYNATIAEIIVSLLSGSGATVTNQQWLNQINQSYGVESTLATATSTDGTIGAMYEAGLFSIDNAGHYVDNGLADAIRQQSAYNSTGVSQLFETTATDMELGAWQTADAATNLGEATASGISVGTLGQLAGAVSMGVNLGILANKFANWAGNKMANNLTINSNINTSNITTTPGWQNSYYSFYINNTTQYVYTVKYQDGCIFYVCNFPSASDYGKTAHYSVLYNATSGTKQYQRSMATGSVASALGNTRNITSGSALQLYSNSGNSEINAANVNSLDFNSVSDYNAWYSSLGTGSNIPTTNNYPYKDYSPDVIGPGGNQRPASNAQNYQDVTSWPDLRSPEQLQQDNTGIQPIPWQNYIDQSQIFNNNTENNITNIDQGDVYNNFINNYITTPSQVPQDTTVQKPSYNPTVPEQPTANEKVENSSEVDQANTDYMTTPSLKTVFPFCVPFDLVSLFKTFDTIEREAPVIEVPFVSELFGIDEDIIIDLSPYDDVAALLRLLELIGFGIGLVILTRYIIGAN